MPGCFNFSIFQFYEHRLQVLYRACGLESRLVDLADGTIMKCWMPQTNKARAMTVSSQKPPLVLLHAFSTSASSWNHQVKPFSKLFDLYIPDLVFHGDSTTTNSERSELFQAECVAKMLEQLSVPRYSLVGTSYGGFVAYRMAHMYPESVDKLVISSSGVIMDSSSDQALVDKYNLSDIKDLLLPTTVEGMRRTISLGFHKQPPFPVPRFICEDYLRVIINKNYKERSELADGLVLGRDDSPPLPPVPQNVLIVWGEFDEVFKLKLAFQLKEHIGEKAKVVVIKSTAHVPQAERASEYNKQVIAFLTEGLSEDTKKAGGQATGFRYLMGRKDKTSLGKGM